MANYFEYTAGREGDHAVTMCQKLPGDIVWAQRVDFETANKIGAGGGYQCETIQPGFYAGPHMVDVIPVCIKEQGQWQLRYTTPYTGNQAWNYGLEPSTAHVYQSTVLPPATSECEEPYSQTSPATSTAVVSQPQSLPTSLPAVGAHLDMLMAFVVAFAVILLPALMRRWHQWRTAKTAK